MAKYTSEEFREMIDDRRRSVKVRVRMATPLAGGMVSSKKQVEDFVTHVMKFSPDTDEFTKMVSQILNEEVKEAPAPDDAEVKVEKVYSVKVLRGDEHGTFVLDHMVKAVMKQSSTCQGIFSAKRGSPSKLGAKSSIVEMTTVRAVGDSLKDPERPWKIYLQLPEGQDTSFAVVQGNVSIGPGGKRSVKNHTQTAPEGTVFEFEVRWPDWGTLKDDDLVRIFAGVQQIGFGSCLSMGYGKIEVELETSEKKKGEAA